MAQLPDVLATLAKSDLEGLCVDCGLCCHASVKVQKGVNVLVPELACKHLTRQDGKSCCDVYETRHEVAKGWCFPLADAIEKGLFPEICPYVRDMKGYVGTVVLDDPYYEMVRPQLRKSILESGKPEWMSSDMWKAFAQ